MERQRRRRDEPAYREGRRGAENNQYERHPFDENRYSMYNDGYDDNYIASNYYDDEEYDRWSSGGNHLYNSDHDNYERSGPYFPDYDESEFEDDDFDDDYRYADERRDGRKRGGFEAMGQNNRYGGNAPEDNDRHFYRDREREEEDYRQRRPTDSYFSMPGESRGRVRKQNGERGNRRRSH
jgi:hypothetical protein